MASSPALQLPVSALDLYGASTISSTRSHSDPRLGVLYDNVVLAAGAPVHFHPVSPTKFLVAFSRTWSQATPSATQFGYFSSYTESQTPSWYLADKTGWRGMVGSTAQIPIATPYDSITLVDGCSRAPNLVFLLHSLTKDAVTQGLVQLFQFSVNGRVLPINEELIPSLPTPGVVFDKGVAFTTPNLTVFGTDDGGNVFMARKSWAAIGTTVSKSAQRGNFTTPWQFGTGTGWSADATQAAPEPGLTSDGPISYGVWRNTTYVVTTTVADDNTVSAQVYSQLPGNPWKKFGAPIALGSTADGSYLGGTAEFQTMMGPNPTMVNTPQAETAFPYCVSTKSRVAGEDALDVSWGLLQIPRQV